MVPTPPVPPALRPYVASRVVYDVDFRTPGIHRGLPTTTLTLVLPIQDPLRVGWAGGTPRPFWSSLSGLHPAPAAIHHDGTQRGIQLGLTVAGARALLGRPAADLAGELTGLDEAMPDLAGLPDRLHDLSSWSARVRLVDDVLESLLRREACPPARGEVRFALAALTRGAPVAAVAEQVGYSRRRLSTLVRDECGVTPRYLQRLGRFECSRRVLAARPRDALADIAADCGYSDHAHLTREWTAFAGCPPSTWLREEFPFVQDGGARDRQG